MIRTAAILILLASPALAVEPCFITKRVPAVDWSRAQPPLPVDGSRVRPSNTPELKAGYARWIDRWRTDMAARQETVRKVEVPCQPPLPLARWQQPGAPFPPPGSVVTVPHEDYPPDARPWDRTPDAVPVPAPGAWAVVGGFLLLISARARRRGKVGGEYHGY